MDSDLEESSESVKDKKINEEDEKNKISEDISSEENPAKVNQSPNENLPQTNSTIGDLANPNQVSLNSDDRLELDIGRRTLTIAIVSVHLACASSRLALGINDDTATRFIAATSWIIYSLFVTGLIILLNRRLGILLNSDFIIIPALSLTWMVFIGAVVALLGWINDIADPIQWWTTGFTSLIFSFGLYLRYNTRNYDNSISIIVEKPSISVILGLSFLICTAICGPVIMNYTGINTWSMGSLLLISIFPLIARRTGEFSDYLILYSISLAVLLLHSLVSEEIVGTDVQTEYLFANNVIQIGRLDILGAHRFSTALSTQLILPNLSLWTGMSLTSTMKITYPLIYSFTPVLLYFSYSKAFSRDVSFYAALVTVFCFAYYVSMLNVIRQGFAEIFLLSAIALLSGSDLLRMYRLRVYTVPFLLMMTVSHYGINYILYPLLWISLFTLWGLSLFINIDNKGEDTFAYIEGNRDLSGDEGVNDIEYYQFHNDVLLDEEGILTLEEFQQEVIRSNPLLNPYQLLAGSLFVVVWHLAAGSGVVIDKVLEIILETQTQVIEVGLIESIFSTQPSETITTTLEPLHEITKISYYFLVITAIIGIRSVLRAEGMSRSTRSFLTLAIGSSILFVPFFVFPSLAVRLEFTRIFHWLLMFLSPFCIVGFFLLCEKFNSYLPQITMGEGNINSITGMFLFIFLLLNSGFLYQISDESNRMVFDSEMAFYRYDSSDKMSAEWIEEHLQYETSRPCAWADIYNSRLYTRYWGEYQIFSSQNGANEAKFVYLGDENLRDNGFYLKYNIGSEFHQNILTDYSDLPSEYVIFHHSKIYDSGNSNWLLSSNGCRIPQSYLLG